MLVARHTQLQRRLVFLSRAPLATARVVGTRHHGSNAADATAATSAAARDAKEGFVSYADSSAPQASHSPWARNLMIDLSKAHVLSVYRKLLAETDKLPQAHQRMFVRGRVRRQFRANMHVEPHSDDHIMHIRVAISHIDDIKAKAEHLRSQHVADDRLTEQQQRQAQHEADARERAQHEQDVNKESLESWKQDGDDDGESSSSVVAPMRAQPRGTPVARKAAGPASSSATPQPPGTIPIEEYNRMKEQQEAEYLQETGWREVTEYASTATATDAARDATPAGK